MKIYFGLGLMVLVLMFISILLFTIKKPHEYYLKKLSVDGISSERELSAIIPGYLETRIYAHVDNCIEEDFDGLYAASGIPIGICSPLSIDTAFMLSYTTEEIEVDNGEWLHMYTFTVYIFTSGCFELLESYELPTSSPFHLPTSLCTSYNKFSTYTNNIVSGFNQGHENNELTIMTRFRTSETPWTSLSTGQFTFNYTTADECSSVPIGTSPALK